MVHILYNPLSNGGHGCEGLDKVIGAFQDVAPAVQDITTLDTRSFLEALPPEDMVVLCGGDGTINHLVNDTVDARISVPIYIWKFGTGNDFWRDIPVKCEKQMVRLSDYTKHLPYAEVNGKRIYFVNNCSFGMDGLVCEMGDAEKVRTGRRVSYAKLAIRAILKDYRRTTATVTVDGESRTYEKVWMATTMNGRYVGGGMKLAPGQDRNSDMVCCIVWHGTPRLATIPLFLSVFWGGHVKLKAMFDIHFGRDIRVEFNLPTALQLDGEVISGVTGYSAHK